MLRRRSVVVLTLCVAVAGVLYSVFVAGNWTRVGSAQWSAEAKAVLRGVRAALRASSDDSRTSAAPWQTHKRQRMIIKRSNTLDAPLWRKHASRAAELHYGEDFRGAAYSYGHAAGLLAAANNCRELETVLFNAARLLVDFADSNLFLRGASVHSRNIQSGYTLSMWKHALNDAAALLLALRGRAAAPAWLAHKVETVCWAEFRLAKRAERVDCETEKLLEDIWNAIGNTAAARMQYQKFTHCFAMERHGMLEKRAQEQACSQSSCRTVLAWYEQHHAMLARTLSPAVCDPFSQHAILQLQQFVQKSPQHASVIKGGLGREALRSLAQYGAALAAAGVLQQETRRERASEYLQRERYTFEGDRLLMLIMRRLSCHLSGWKATFAMIAEYRSGSRLPLHRDQPQCVLSLSMVIRSDLREEPTCFPLDVVSVDESRELRTERLCAVTGDIIVFNGRRAVHGRERLPKGAHLTVILLHFVPDNFPERLVSR